MREVGPGIRIWVVGLYHFPRWRADLGGQLKCLITDALHLSSPRDVHVEGSRRACEPGARRRENVAVRTQQPRKGAVGRVPRDRGMLSYGGQGALEAQEGG